MEVAQKRTLLVLPFTPQPNVLPNISADATQRPKPLTADRLEALL